MWLVPARGRAAGLQAASPLAVSSASRLGALVPSVSQLVESWASRLAALAPSASELGEPSPLQLVVSSASPYRNRHRRCCMRPAGTPGQELRPNANGGVVPC